MTEINESSATAEGSPPGGPRATILESDDLALWKKSDRMLQDLGLAPRRSARALVLSTCGVELLSDALPIAARALDLHLQVDTIAHAAPEATLLASALKLLGEDPDYVVLAGSVEDLEADGPERSVDRWTSLWASVKRTWGCRVVQLLFVPRPDDSYGTSSLMDERSQYRRTREVNAQLRDAADDDVLVVDCEFLAVASGVDKWRDSRYWSMFRQDFGPGRVAEVARATAGAIAADQGLSRKCLVVDLDRTMWNGILGEDGPSGVAIDDDGPGLGFRDLQQFLLGLHSRGVALAIASKNDSDLVELGLQQVPGMQLTAEHFSVIVGAWCSKSQQLAEIAAAMRLGTDSLILIDDSPFECSEVLAALPEVDIVWHDGDPRACLRKLRRRSTLTVPALTGSDMERNASYRALSRAEADRRSSASKEDFLRGLEMIADLRPLGDEDVDRVAQLLARTNQFNLTGERPSRAELQKRLCDPDQEVITLRLADRYGSHGLVGVVATNFNPSGEAAIDVLALSCRALGRDVERVLVGRAVDQARRRGAQTLCARYVPSGRNSVAATLYDDLGFRQVDSTDECVDYSLDLSSPSNFALPHIEERQ